MPFILCELIRNIQFQHEIGFYCVCLYYKHKFGDLFRLCIGSISVHISKSGNVFGTCQKITRERAYFYPPCTKHSFIKSSSNCILKKRGKQHVSIMTINLLTYCITSLLQMHPRKTLNRFLSWDSVMNHIRFQLELNLCH